MATRRLGLRGYLLIAGTVALALGSCSSASGSPTPGSSAPGSPASGSSASGSPLSSPSLAPSPSAAHTFAGDHTPTPPPSRAPNTATLADFFLRCPTAAEVADVNSRLKVTFVGAPDLKTLACTAAQGSADLSAIQKKAYQVMIIMRYLSFSKPLPWTSQSLYEWFTVGSGITGITFTYQHYDHPYDPKNPPIPSSCCSPPHVVNIQYSEINFLMTTNTWSNMEMGVGLSDIVALLVHEARHNLAGPHTCAAGDKTIAEMGASGVEYLFWVWIETYSDREFLRAPGDDPLMYLYSAEYDAYRVRAGNFCNEAPLPSGLYEQQQLPSQG
jgi:hypothetical protein